MMHLTTLTTAVWASMVVFGALATSANDRTSVLTSQSSKLIRQEPHRNNYPTKQVDNDRASVEVDPQGSTGVLLDSDDDLESHASELRDSMSVLKETLKQMEIELKDKMGLYEKLRKKMGKSLEEDSEGKSLLDEANKLLSVTKQIQLTAHEDEKPEENEDNDDNNTDSGEDGEDSKGQDDEPAREKSAKVTDQGTTDEEDEKSVPTPTDQEARDQAAKAADEAAAEDAVDSQDQPNSQEALGQEQFEGEEPPASVEEQNEEQEGSKPSKTKHKKDKHSSKKSKHISK